MAGFRKVAAKMLEGMVQNINDSNAQHTIAAIEKEEKRKTAAKRQGP